MFYNISQIGNSPNKFQMLGRETIMTNAYYKVFAD